MIKINIVSYLHWESVIESAGHLTTHMANIAGKGNCTLKERHLYES